MSLLPHLGPVSEHLRNLRQVLPSPFTLSTTQKVVLVSAGASALIVGALARYLRRKKHVIDPAKLKRNNFSGKRSRASGIRSPNDIGSIASSGRRSAAYSNIYGERYGRQSSNIVSASEKASVVSGSLASGSVTIAATDGGGGDNGQLTPQQLGVMVGLANSPMLTTTGKDKEKEKADTNVTHIMEEDLNFEDSDDSLRDPNYETNDDFTEDSDQYTDGSNAGQMEGKQEKSRKRKRKQNNWKINKQHKKVISGLEHKSKKKIIPKKTVGPPCNASCRLKCIEKICEDERKNINAMFWDGSKDINQKRQFVASHVKVVPIFRKRRRTGARKDARCHTRNYFFQIKGSTERVCRTFFHNTLNISQTFVTTALSKKEPGGIIAEDGRGKHNHHAKIPEFVKQHVRDHIRKFPVEESHYSRERNGRTENF